MNTKVFILLGLLVGLLTIRLVTVLLSAKSEDRNFRHEIAFYTAQVLAALLYVLLVST